MAGLAYHLRQSCLLLLLQIVSQLVLPHALPAAAEASSEFVKGKICIGTNGRMSAPSNKEHHFRNLKERYTNCTYVDGNLELTWLQDEHLDLSFLQSIKEVTGHVLISHVDVKRIVLPNLQIIRGQTLFKLNLYNESFALMVLFSKMHTLEMPSLRDILTGTVGFYNNYNLCHVRGIRWDEIMTEPVKEIKYVYNFTSAERECPPCDPSCEMGCWGEGPENCQKFSKINCSPQCHQGRCFGKEPRQCCHLFCAGGCTGPTQKDCIACRNFYDDGVCTQECPPMQRYNSITYSWEINPHGKYAYGATCVKNCPEHLLKDNGACVRSCPHKKKAVNNECVPCDGPCPKTCRVNTDIVHSGNIDTFTDCTIIDGSITILDQTFKGFKQLFDNYTLGKPYPPMHPDRLEVFSTLKEVTGFINIQGDHPDFKNLSYFRNLEIIGGRVLTDYLSSLYIVKTSLTSLRLQSLRKINSGAVAILENKKLCFADNIKWDKITKSEHGKLLSGNMADDDCRKEKLVCDEQCSDEGCWGTGPDQCLSCSNFKFENTCLQNCSVMEGFYESERGVCMACHEECDGTCYGPGTKNCSKCKNVRDGPFCVPTCPESKYNDSGTCRPCHSNCIGGCTGPNNTVGEGGCRSCHKAIITGEVKVERCLEKNEACPEGYFYEYVMPQEQGSLKSLAGRAICRKCHPRCKKCIGYGFHEQVCQECKNYKRGEQCEDECPQDHYVDDSSHLCFPCASECKGCTGPNNSHCLDCRNFRIYSPGWAIDDNSTSFNCTETCPQNMSYIVYPASGSKPYCSVEQPVGMKRETERSNTILMVVIVCACILIVFLLCLCYQFRLRTKAKENVAKCMSMAMQGLDEPLRPTNVKPNLAKLRIIKEAEMRRGGVLGYGAFGTVYKGVWVPEGENVKIPVAIKVLRERSGANTSKEFLEEAYIMATVEHPNLLQLLAVCMTSQMMLVTQLMPLGCLLDYVKNNKERIGSKLLLNWCTQIARGMAYLEEKRLVHRDLAARNVLVQTPNCVKITDFGLAKLLDINEDEYKANGGKMPIKWLALESIQHRIFTHKSDIWAFGVTVWELLTYGGRPYENVPAREVPEHLEKGERLPQPNICTIEVYMVMIKCWMLDPEVRPNFKELADEFAKMARDPGRYLVIIGDTFMRLPSYSSQDDKEQTSLEMAEGGGEEYLQPKCRAGIVSPSPQPESPIPQNQTNWDREIHKYPQPRRYCSDPLAMKENEMGDDCGGTKREAQVGDLKLELPLDEDDYLMPSPQQSQATTAYMDLIGDSKLPEDMPDGKGMLRNYHPDFLPPQATIVDNPEYHLFSGNGDAVIQVATPGHQKSSEEESDHEYYNDFDRHRELQPLRRSETTV